jgi:DNA-directed RNA polymerase specialized sigma24 family protein
VLKELSPVVERQAARLSPNQVLAEDAAQEGKIKLWTLLQQGVRNRAYLLASTRNCILNFLAHESYEPLSLGVLPSDRGEAPPRAELLPDPGDPFAEVHARAVLAALPPRVASAVSKLAHSGEPMTGAERVALTRFRQRLAQQAATLWA